MPLKSPKSCRNILSVYVFRRILRLVIRAEGETVTFTTYTDSFVFSLENDSFGQETL